ncbi:MAG: hypothetical protein WA417_16175 [Stellaceae bacterium]
MKHSESVVADTITELNRDLDPAQVLLRLEDWRDRVHRLHDEIEKDLGRHYFYDRAGKHITQEDIVQRAGLPQREVPPIDILQIEGPHRRVLATIQPRYLWIIGANGRLDLLVTPKIGMGRRQFMLMDLSRPLAGESDWRLVSPAERLEQPRFTVNRLRELLE